VSWGMVRFAQSDDELALILAKELSLNILLQSGWEEASWAPTAAAPLKALPISDMADAPPAGAVDIDAVTNYLGVYLAARAGYDVAQASSLVLRLGALEVATSASDDARAKIVRRYLVVQKAVREITGSDDNPKLAEIH
jgi:hypothetical protein